MSKKTKTPWRPTDQRFVGFIDILGFKDLVMRSDHDEIYKLLNNISTFRNFLENIHVKGNIPESFSDAEIYTVSFSDSIVIFSKDKSEANFKLFIQSINWLIARAIETGILLKGAISFGQVSVNQSSQIYFGQAIIDAYLLENEVNYLGVVAHNSIDRYIEEISFVDDKPYMFESETYLKSGLITHTNLNWFRMIKGLNDENDKPNLVLEKIKSLKPKVSGSPRRYIDNTLKMFEKVNTAHNLV
jgi:hypothetical protein